jgi:peptidyl-prolyl cis-trans isomerase C
MPLRPLLLSTLVLLAGCRREEAPTLDLRHTRQGGTPVATFGEDSITAEELSAHFAQLPNFQRERYQALEERKAYAEGLARFELLAREAARRGLHNEPEVVTELKKLMVYRLLRQELEGKPQPLTEQELAAWYAQHQADFVRPEQVRLSHIFLALPPGQPPEAVRQKAEALLAEARALPPLDFSGFGKLAAQHDEDPQSRPLNGDLRFRSRAELEQAYGPAVAEAAFALAQPGQLSAVVEGRGGLHLLKLQSRTPALNATLDQPQVRNRITQALRAERQRAAYEALLTQLAAREQLTLREEALAALKVDLRAPMRPPEGPAPGYLDAPSALGTTPLPTPEVPPFSLSR